MTNSVFVSLVSNNVWQRDHNTYKKTDVLESSYETWEEAHEMFEEKRANWQSFADRWGLRTVSGESLDVIYFDVLDGDKLVCELEIWPTPFYNKKLEEMDLPF